MTYITSGFVGPALGGFISQHFHWSMIFWLNIPMGFVALAIVAVALAIDVLVFWLVYTILTPPGGPPAPAGGWPLPQAVRTATASRQAPAARKRGGFFFM